MYWVCLQASERWQWARKYFYVTIAKKLGLGDASLVGGWTLHFVVGLVAGAVFVGVTGQVKRLALTTTRKCLWVGVLAGIGVWVVVYVPVTGFLVPTDLTDATFAVGSLVLHVVYGVVTAIVSLSLLRRGSKQRPSHNSYSFTGWLLGLFREKHIPRPLSVEIERDGVGLVALV